MPHVNNLNFPIFCKFFQGLYPVKHFKEFNIQSNLLNWKSSGLYVLF